MPLTSGRMQVMALALTLTLETAGLLLWWGIARPRCSLGRALVVLVLANLITHPLLWVGLRHLPADNALGVTLGETLVVGAEAAAYGWLLALRRSHALALGLSLNLASWFGGIYLWQLWLPFRI